MFQFGSRSCTYLTHSNLLCGELVPVCVNHGLSLTMLQILVECPHYGKAYLTFHIHGTLTDMLVDDHNSVGFLKCIMACRINLFDLVLHNV
jgi:hypothetical protein